MAGVASSHDTFLAMRAIVLLDSRFAPEEAALIYERLILEIQIQGDRAWHLRFPISHVGPRQRHYEGSPLHVGAGCEMRVRLSFPNREGHANDVLSVPRDRYMTVGLAGVINQVVT